MWRKKGWYPSFLKIPRTSVSLLCHGETRPPEKPNRKAVNSGQPPITDLGTHSTMNSIYTMNQPSDPTSLRRHGATVQAPRVKYDTGRTNNNQQLILQTTFRVGTWKVRGMNRPGKVENIVSEAADMPLDEYCLSETHWTQSEDMTIGEHMMITSSDQSRNYQGVGLIISKNLRKSVLSYNAVSSRIVTIRIKARLANMSIIQIYAPTLDKDDEVHNEVYEQLLVTIESIKISDYLIVTPSWETRKCRV